MKGIHPLSEITSCLSKVGISSFVVMALSGIMGGVSLALFTVFLFTGLPSQMDLGLDEHMNLYINTWLCFLFFFQHSLMLRTWFRKWLSGLVPRSYLDAFFSICSGLFLLILMIFWQKSTSIQIELDGAPCWLMRALFFLSIIGFYFSIRSLRPFDPLGIQVLCSHLTGKTAAESFLSLQGVYQWVRHPIYFFSLLMIWSQVSITTDRLLFNGLWTFWIITGAFLEEKDLIASFGDGYRNYQRNVPMLIPYRWSHRNQNQQ